MNTKKFLESLQSKTTEKTYGSSLKLYELFVNEKGFEWSSIDSVQAYIGYLKKSGIAIGTIKNRIACIRSLFIFSKLPVTDFPVVKGNAYTPTEGLDDNEVVRIFKCIDESNYVGKRDSALIHLMLFTGVRCSEARNIKLEDLTEIGKRKIISVLGKGNKTRRIVLTDMAWNKMSALILEKLQAGAKSSYLFTKTAEDALPIHQGTIRNILLKYVREAGITKRISPHSTRVTCISNVIENGANTFQVLRLGGWSSLESAVRYEQRMHMLKNSAALFINYDKKPNKE